MPFTCLFWIEHLILALYIRDANLSPKLQNICFLCVFPWATVYNSPSFNSTCTCFCNFSASFTFRPVNILLCYKAILNKAMCVNCKIKVDEINAHEKLTSEWGIKRRMSDTQYKHTEIATPARKLDSSRLLSFVGIKAILSALVNSKSLWDTCRNKSRWQDDSRRKTLI